MIILPKSIVFCIIFCSVFVGNRKGLSETLIWRINHGRRSSIQNPRNFEWLRVRAGSCLAHILKTPHFSPSLPQLKQLHWLPVIYRIKFKLSTLTYRALSTQQPPYLASLLHLSNILRQLRSSISQQLIVPS